MSNEDLAERLKRLEQKVTEMLGGCITTDQLLHHTHLDVRNLQRGVNELQQDVMTLNELVRDEEES